MILQESQMSLFEESEVWTLSVEDFRARLSALLESDEDLKILEGLFSLKSLGLHLFSDLSVYSLRTSQDSSAMKGGDTFETIIRTLDELGYDAEWQVFNSKNFGVPQNRERVFIIGHLRGAGGREVFPFGESDSETNQHEGHQDITSTLTARYPANQDVGTYVVENREQKEVKQVGNLIDTDSFGGNLHRGRVYDPEGLSPCLTCNGGGNLEPKIIQRGHGFNSGGEHQIAPTLTSNSYHENNLLKIKEATKKGYAEATVGDSVNLSHPDSETRRGRVGKQLANTLLTGEEQGVVDANFRIRKLTPRECWRLQGFPDWAFDKASQVNSNSQLYKQAGNSVTVNVIAAIARRL